MRFFEQLFDHVRLRRVQRLLGNIQRGESLVDDIRQWHTGRNRVVL